MAKNEGCKIPKNTFENYLHQLLITSADYAQFTQLLHLPVSEDTLLVA
jgi:hypothetical protein